MTAARLLDGRTADELLKLVEAWDRTPWWRFIARASLAHVIVIKLKYRVLKPLPERMP